MQWEKDSLFNRWCWENWAATYRRTKLDHLLTPHTKINSKQIKDLNVRQETIKILEENTGSNFFDISHSNIFLDMSLKTRETKTKINYWYCIKTKRQPTKWEKTFANDVSDNGLGSKICKNLYN